MKNKIIRELKSWGIIAIVFLALYLTGLHTEVAAFAQRVILYTGLMSPSMELDEAKPDQIDYNFDLQDMEGDVVNFSVFKNKVVFVNIWASWCAPCRAEMPSIQNLYEKADKEDIAFVMLSTDRDPEKARKFIERKGFTFPVYTPAGSIPQAFRAPSIPTTFVLSEDGRIISKKVGMANYDRKSFLNFLNKQVSD